MRAHDWSSSPLGAPEGWPQSLKTAVSLMINSGHPMFIAWGPELAFLYNDGYVPILGAKHPHKLGRPFRYVWPEIWDDVWPLIERALSGKPTWSENLHLVMERNGYPEDTWYSFSYSPIRDESGGVGGMFCACQETTRQVLAERTLRESEERQSFLLQFGDRVRGLGSPGDIKATASEMLGRRLGVARAGYAEIDASGELIRVERDWSQGVATLAGEARLLEGFGEAIAADLRAGQTLRVADCATDPRARGPGVAETWASIDLRSIIAVPLVKEGRFVAFLYLHEPHPRVWRDEEEALAREVAERTWAAVERARAEAEQRESEARFREVADAAPVLVWLADTENKGTWYNKAWLSFTGRTMEQELGDGWLDAVHPDDLPRCARVCGGAFERRQPFRLDFRLRKADGEWRIMDDTGVPRFSEDGRFLGYIGSCVDVTDARRSEEALRHLNESLEARVAERSAELLESERRFRALFNSALQFMALLAPDGTVIEVNETALAWSQIKPDDIVAKPFWLAAPMRENPALQEAVQAGIQRAAAGETVREEHTMRGAGDVRAVVDFSLKPVIGDSGEPVWLIAEGRDITALKQAEDALRQAQKMETIGQLTGGVAHDFNNLLTPIVGALDLLRRRLDGDERAQRLTAGGLQAADRARTLIQRLLAFSRRQHLEPRSVRIDELIGGMVDLLSRSLGPQIRLLLDIAEDLPPARVDPNQFELSLLNLAVNARDAMSGNGTLTIAAGCEAVREHAKLAAGDYVRVAVTDTGIGMDEETLRRAVEPFFTTKGIGRGTGLGLSMVHGLAAQSGGDFLLTSRPGHGTTATLWLPLSQEQVEHPASQDRTDPALRRTQTATVLLVDDEELVRTGTAEMLADAGYTVVEAESAYAALELIKGERTFNALVTDYAMPGMTGTALTREARKLRPGLPVLMITGYAQLGGREAGDLPRLAKPFRQTELAGALAELLEDSAVVNFPSRTRPLGVE